MALKTPQPIAMEHDDLHKKLKKATECGGRTQEAAKEVADLLHTHFEAEEEYALPPLGLLSSVAEGTMPAETPQVLEMTGKLKANLDHMVDEHREIGKALEKLIREATAEGKPEHADFAQELKLHADMEEEILYPASLLIGEYLRLRMDTEHARSSRQEAVATR